MSHPLLMVDCISREALWTAAAPAAAFKNFYRQERANLISRRSRFGVRWRQPPLSNTFGDSKPEVQERHPCDTTRDPKWWLARNRGHAARKISTPEPASGYTRENQPPL